MSIFSAYLSIYGSFLITGICHPSPSLPSLRISTVSCSFSTRPSSHQCPCIVYSSKLGEMAELVEDKESKERMCALERAAVLSLESGADEEVTHSRTFLDARSEEELLSGIIKEMVAGRLPSDVAARMEEIYQNYRNAVNNYLLKQDEMLYIWPWMVLQSGSPNASEVILSNIAVAFDRMLLDVEHPFNFSPYHKAIWEPFDYYMFGQNYIHPLIDFRSSYVGNISIFQDIEENLQKGHNVVLISNHQTEADPMIIALLLETSHPHVAEKMTYVAGDRVLTDPVCKPFSMGRNLVCVYSKKHMHDIPELAEMKKKANTLSLKEMALLLRTGAQIIWIAPSGGRDRPDPSTGEWYPAPFDVSSVDNIRRLSDHSGVPGHIYPLALLCHDVMPPPPQVEKQIGERRMISYHGVGLSVSLEISFKEIAAGIENPAEAKVALSQALYDSVIEQHNVLKSAIHGNRGLDASNSVVSLSQPWK